MEFKTTYPDYAAIEAQIRRARLERSIVLAGYIARFAQWLGNAVKHVATSMQRGYEAERDRRAIEADTFLRRSVTR